MWPDDALTTSVSGVLHAVQEDSVRKEGAFTAEERSAWVRCFLPDSIYLWACGETAESEEDKSTLSDMFIGWVVLVVSFDLIGVSRAGTTLTTRG